MLQSPVLFIEYDSIDSTQDQAARLLPWLIQQGTFPVAITAQEQTKGRGREKRVWVSPKGKNLYLSLVIEIPQAFHTRPYLISSATSLALSKLIQSWGLTSCCIKWPNDLLIDKKKIGGILIEVHSGESHSNSEAHTYAVIGVGLNIAMTQADCSHISGREATSLFAETSSVWDMQKVTVEVIHAILCEIREQAHHPDELLQEWVRACRWMEGTDVTTHQRGGKILHGNVCGFTADGAMIIRNSTGESITLLSDTPL